MASLSKVFRFLLYGCLFVFIVHSWLQTKQYMVNYSDIERIVQRHRGDGKNVKAAFAQIEKELRNQYGAHILPAKDSHWVFVNAGGWMGAMYLLHASLTEYILFFGTEIDTTGHSGRYWANISDTLISGSYRQWSEGTLGSKLYKPGDTIVHKWGEATGMQWTAGTYMVEYGRGFIPSTMLFGLADSVFSTTDCVTVFHTVKLYSKALFNEFQVLIVDNYVKYFK